jgi:ubiquinone/menaquinone biosynthesis C-methylase UbiE
MTETHFSPEIDDDFVQMHEEFLVPSIYGQWAHRVAAASEIDLGHKILDVACGTGSLSKAAQLEAGLKGKLIGLDASEKMLAAAAKGSRGIQWQQGNAESLPFEKNEFDRVLCQFSIMFIDNRVAAIKEMLRVCKPGGLVVVAIWAHLDHSKAYRTLIKLVEKHAGARAAFKLSAPWSLGASGVMDRLLLSTNINEYVCHERLGVSRFPSLESFVKTHLKLVGEFEKLDKETYDNLLNAANVELRPFVVPGGQLVAQLDANIYTVNGIQSL